MFLSLLFVAWMFTLTSPDPKTKDSDGLSRRLFIFPGIDSLSVLVLWLAGQASIVALYACWKIFVPLAHVDMFDVYQNCFGWMTLLALGQGIVWALAAWPITRMLVLTAVFFCFALSPARRDLVESPFVLPPLFILGAGLARAGLQKCGIGQWQDGNGRGFSPAWRPAQS